MVSMPLRPSSHCASTATTRPRAIATASWERSLKSVGNRTVALAIELKQLKTSVITTARMFSPRLREWLRLRDGSRPAFQAYDARPQARYEFAQLDPDRSTAKSLLARPPPV